VEIQSAGKRAYTPCVSHQSIWRP